MSGGVIAPATVGSNSISFAEIVKGRDSTVRVTVDGLIYAVDLVMVMTGKNNNDASECLRELNPSLFNKENFLIRSRSKLVSFQHAIELVMVLPGKVAKETRTQFANIIRRYMAGDASLVDEIEANAQSDSPLAQMARASLTPHGERDRKRQRLMDDAHLKSLSLGNINTAITLLDSLNPSWKRDERLLMRLEDQVKNIVAPPLPSTAIQNGDDNQASITISEVALECGLHLNHAQLIQAGRLAAKAYRIKHNAEPPEHPQWVDGARRFVKSYTEADRDLIEAAVMQV